MSKPAKPWSRLSESLISEKHPGKCQLCGSGAGLHVWQECDQHDQPQQIYVVLCQACADKIIEPHPRLYVQLDQHAPAPGAMPLCVGCIYRDGTGCTHADLTTNGGPGLKLTYPAPTVCLVDGHDKAGRRRGWRQVMYHGPVSACAGRTVAPPNQMQV